MCCSECAPIARILLVSNEYTGQYHLLTQTDILQTIAGDLPLAEKPVDQVIVQREGGSYLVNGRIPIHEFEELLSVDLQHKRLVIQSLTFVGLVMALMKRIPSE